MSIENPVRFCENLWDWAILDGCFGMSRIRPTDVDGMVEHKGKFLLLETKAPGVFLKQGQQIMLDRMASRSDYTVIVIQGKPGFPETLRISNKDGSVFFPDACLKMLRDITNTWYWGAERNSLPQSLTSFIRRLLDNPKSF